jgi:4-amino-4-deoxy-L-arabinose transferase-like glycosyltransferase
MPEKSDLDHSANQFSNHISAVLKDRFFWLSLLLGGFVLSFTLWFSMGADAGMLGYCSWVWVHYNLPPYVGCVTENFPGIFIIHWLILKIFGESVPGFRAFDFLVQLGSLMMIFYIARRLFQSGLAGFLGVLLYATYYYNLDYGFTGEREGFILCLTLVALIIHLALERRFLLRAGLVGLLVGFCFLIKPTAGLLIALACLRSVVFDFRI